MQVEGKQESPWDQITASTAPKNEGTEVLWLLGMLLKDFLLNLTPRFNSRNKMFMDMFRVA